MGSGRFGGSRVTGFGKGWQCGDVGRGSALASGFGLQRGYRQANGAQTCGLLWRVGDGGDPGAELGAEETEKELLLCPQPRTSWRPEGTQGTGRHSGIFCFFVYNFLQSADLTPPEEWIFMVSQMKGGRRHLRVLHSVLIQISLGWAPQGSTLLSLVCVILLGILKALPPRHPLPAPIFLKKWAILPSEISQQKKS